MNYKTKPSLTEKRHFRQRLVVSGQKIGRDHVDSLDAFGALFDFGIDLLAFFWLIDPFILNNGVVDEHIDHHRN
jgi:hypothetical protein